MHVHGQWKEQHTNTEEAPNLMTTKTILGVLFCRDNWGNKREFSCLW